jgi:hypothetical protein
LLASGAHIRLTVLRLDNHEVSLDSPVDQGCCSASESIFPNMLMYFSLAEIS